MRVAIAVGPGFTDSGVSIALDVLRTANAILSRQGRAPRFEVTVCSADGRPVASAAGLRVEALKRFVDAARAHVLFVPGTWFETEGEVLGWLETKAFRSMVELVRRAHARGAQVLGSCSGTFVLGRAGLLDGLAATTSWWLARAFARSCPLVQLDPTRALIAHPRIATAGAVFAQADLSLHLVRMTAGPQLASLVTKYLLLDEHAGQAPYMALSQLVSGDEVLEHAERWLRSHLSEALDLPALCRAIGTSPRTLSRRVQTALSTSPARWVGRLRAEEATRLLETSRDSVERVAERVGFGSAATLRRELLALLGASPRAVRRRAQTRAGLAR